MFKVLIRPLQIEDAKISWVWRNDPEVWKLTGNRPDKTITFDVEHEWLKNVLSDDSTKRFAITVDDLYVGNVQLTSLNAVNAEFHIFIGEKQFWSKGVAKEATYQILHYAKQILKLQEVYLYVKKANIGAVNVYKKNSFVIESEDSTDCKMICELDQLRTPEVSIFCMVYNHANFLKDALEGFLMQKSSFSTVIVIGEYCSTDNSREVIEIYAKMYPGKFILLYHDLNIGAHKNQEMILKNCVGKYVAMCEGDDYWVDPLKLQKQVDFLEANGDFSICFHNTGIVYEKGIEPFLENINSSTAEVTNIFDLLKGNYIHTASVVFRNNSDYPTWLGNAYPGDWPLHIINSTYGKIKFMKDVMAYYRVHYGGVHSTTGGQPEKTLHTYKNLCEELELRGLIKESRFACKLYNNWFAAFYGLKDGELRKYNRFGKSIILLRQGSIKLKFLFWLPLLFNNTSNKVYGVILNIYSKFK